MNLLSEKNVSVKLPMQMMVDNKAAIKQIDNDAMSSAQKHTDVKRSSYAKRAPKASRIPSTSRPTR